MQKVGVDIVEIGRIREAVSRWPDRFLKRIYTDAEIALSKNRPSFFAARFAAKEAVMKALGTGTEGVGWRDIEILAMPSGEPLIRLYGRAKIVAAGLSLGEFAVSLSHSREYAVAVVVTQSTTDP